MEVRTGTVIAGRYQVVGPIGQGGMGTVYVARDQRLERKVALKLMSEGTGPRDELMARFAREARALARVRSPHVVQVFDTGGDQGTHFIAMELLSGMNLDAYLARRGLLSLEEAYAVFGPVLDALEATHRERIVHRDLKPSNIFLAKDDDGTTTVKVLDFGIAKVDDGRTTGSLMGTPWYMSPEQLYGDRIDARTDLWSVGVLLFQALTGQHPFSGTNDRSFAMLRATMSAPLLPASSIVPSLGPEVDAFLAKALDREPELRFQTAREMHAAFAELAGVTAMVPASLLKQEGQGFTLDAVELAPIASALPPPKLEATAPLGMGAAAVEVAGLGPTLVGIPGPPGLASTHAPHRVDNTEALHTLVRPPKHKAPDPWTGFGALVPDGLAEHAGVIERFLTALFERFEAVSDRIARLHAPRFDDGASHQFFAILMADSSRGDRRLLTQTFVGYADSLEKHLGRLDPKARKVVLAIVDSNELGAGVRQQIFELNKKFGALVLPVNIGQLCAAVEDGTALDLLQDGLADFHTFPDVFAVGARNVDATSFFGLRVLVNDLVRHFDKSALISIWGPPGCGKTSLVEIARGELTRWRFHRVRCVEVPERTVAATVAEIERSLGAAPQPDAGIRERIEAAARGARQQATLGGQRAALVLEDADLCLAALVSPGASDEERAAARALWMALGRQCAEGVIAVVVTSLSGFVLGDAKLLDWMNPLANQVVKVEVPPLAFGDVRKMVVDLSLQINVAFDDGAVRRVYERSAGNVYVARRLCQHIVKPRRRSTASSPLEKIVIEGRDVDAAAGDLAAMGDTFRSTVLPWLDTAERQVLEIVAARRPRRVKEVQGALEGQCPADDCAAALERLRRMGFVERRDGRERVAIPLLEEWVKHNLAPTAGEAERRRSERVRYFTAGASMTLLLLGGYWMWSMPKETSWQVGACRYELDYPSRAVTGAEVKLHAFRGCTSPPDATPVALVARPGTFAHLGKDGEPRLSLHEPGKPDWTQLEVIGKFEDVGKHRFELDVTVGSERTREIVVTRDWIAQLPGLVKALILIAGAIPAAIGTVMAFHREVADQVKRLLGRGEPAPPAAGG